MKKILILFVFLAAISSASAQMTDASGMDWETNLKTPHVSTKASAAVGRHIQTIEKWFKNNNLSTRTVRNGEVLVVTIPAADLFEANSSELRPEALAKLALFERAIIHPEAYRILVAAHTDDTGDEKYSETLAEQRAENVQDAFEEIAAKANTQSNIYYYSFGFEKPLVANNSIANRNKNRRIEVYIIPEQRTIDNARSGKL